VPDGSIVRPYGDTTGDGMVQTSFTLPVPPGPRADAAALQLATKMGIEPAMVVHSHGIGDGFTFFVVYGSVKHLVDLTKGGADYTKHLMTMGPDNRLTLQVTVR